MILVNLLIAARIFQVKGHFEMIKGGCQEYHYFGTSGSFEVQIILIKLLNNLIYETQIL